MKRFKVIVTARSFGSADNKAKELLEKHGCEVIKINSAKMEKEIVDADAVIAGLEEYPQEILQKGKGLKVISRYGVGYDNVDVEAAKRQDIKVTITPGANGDSVADLAVALMLEAARNISVMDQAMKQEDQKRPPGVEMWQKTLGVIGAGRIGQGVARRCRGFDMKVLCYDTYQDEAFKEACNASYVSLDEIIEKADFITIHAPLNKDTKDMFNKQVFNRMKKNAIIVNTARGGIINEDDLYEALKNGDIRGAALDATLKEPPYGSPLLGLDNCIITPHAGAATIEASSKMSYLAARNVIDILLEGQCENAIK